jgi:hypothetical protein
VGETIKLDELVPSAQGGIVRGVAPVLARIMRSAPAGSVIDARKLTGTVFLESDPFGGLLTADMVLMTGEVVFERDFNQGMLALPSRFRWEMAGTRVRPAIPVRAISTDTSPGAALVATAVVGGYCQVGPDLRRVTLDTSEGVNPGARMAIFGAWQDEDVSFTLAAPLSQAHRGTLALRGNVAGTLAGSSVYLALGREILRVSVQGANVRIDERGALGTRARAHDSGTRAVLARSQIATIRTVKGKQVELVEPVARQLTPAIFRIGSIGTLLHGEGEIQGSYNGQQASLFSGIGSTLSTTFECAHRISVNGCSHGGLFLFGATRSNIRLERIAGIGRREQKLGASVWLFGETTDCDVTVREADRGNIGIAIDNKSSGVSYYGLDGPPRRNHVEVGSITNHLAGLQISGGYNNICHIGLLDATDTDVIIDDSASQATRPIVPRSNTVVIERQHRVRPDYVSGSNQVLRYRL